MRLKEYFSGICASLSEVYPPEEARAMAFIVLDHYLHLKREDIFLRPDSEIGEDRAVSGALEQLRRHRPLQYVLGESECCGLTFRVDESVLIPRPETEELVRRILEDWHGKSPRILDIGTGSGVIAVSLAKWLAGSRVEAVDISVDALTVARENARRNEMNVRFIQMDILAELPGGKYDLIVSNPPYVRESERSLMRRNVVDYEPETALFVRDDDPLLFYRRIAEAGSELLDKGGLVYFEINEAFGLEVVSLLEGEGYVGVESFRDLFGKERMVKGIRP